VTKTGLSMNIKTLLAIAFLSLLPKRVGRRVTGGCFVMDNTDGLALARRIRPGTEVNIMP
jgi:hypothetical protein